MARNFKMHYHHKNGNLYIYPQGTLDGSSAWEIVNLVHAHYQGKGNVFIHTRGVTEILPFAAAIIKSRLGNGRVPRSNVYFKGEKGYEIAPSECRVLVTTMPSCQCRGKCGGNGCRHKEQCTTLTGREDAEPAKAL